MLADFQADVKSTKDSLWQLLPKVFHDVALRLQL